MKWITCITAVLITGLVILPAAYSAGPSDVSGSSSVGHQYLYEKDPATWEIVPDGAWGKMKYFTARPNFEFVFNGHGLVPGTEYKLVYFPDPWPGEGLVCLGTQTANAFGDVHIQSSVPTGDLPNAGDYNGMEDPPGCTTCIYGAKIWLVLSGDAVCGSGSRMISWHPADYIFEETGIFYTQTIE